MLPSTTVLLPGLPVAGSRRSRQRSDGSFWILQLLVWPAYGLVLMLPWLGTYTVASMVPNKVIVAGSGLLVSGGLRSLYRAGLSHRPSAAVLVALVVTASITAGLAWDLLLAGLLGGSAIDDLRRMGAIGSGIPQLAGGLYHGLVLLTWSMTYLGLKHYLLQPPDGSTREEPIGAEGFRRLVLRDGRRAVVLGMDEIGWVEAAGDYVRVHTGNRRLLLRATISGIAAALPETDFVRIHRSSIVPIARVRELIPLPNREYDVVLQDGTRLRASRTYAGRLRAVLGIRPVAAVPRHG